MGISSWEVPVCLICLLSGAFFIVGLMEFLDAVKMSNKLKRLEKACTQKAQGTITPQTQHRGKHGFGQVVYFSYEVEEKRFTQKSSIGYEDGTYQWGQQVTVYYDPIKPEDCYLDGDIKLAHRQLVSGILFVILLSSWCLLWGYCEISRILRML